MLKLLCALLFTVGTLRASELTGVLYSNESGPSGRGTGQVRIFADGAINQIGYQKPFLREFAGKSCDELGAIWSVTTAPSPGGGQQIERVRCKGDVDARIHNAWLLVTRALALLGKGGSLPMDMLAPSLRGSSRIHGIETTLKTLNLEDYQQFGGEGRCLRISSSREGPVVIAAGDNCDLTANGNPVSVRFTVVSAPPDHRAALIADVAVRER